MEREWSKITATKAELNELLAMTESYAEQVAQRFPGRRIEVVFWGDGDQEVHIDASSISTYTTYRNTTDGSEVCS